MCSEFAFTGWFGEEFYCKGECEFIGRDVFGDVGEFTGIAFSLLDVGAKASDSDFDVVGEFHGVDLLGIDSAKVLCKVFKTRLIIVAVEEVCEPLHAFFSAVSDLIEIFFHRCGEFVIDEFREVLFEKTCYGECEKCWDKCASTFSDIAAVLDGGHDGCECGGAADT